jgi:hypothetical protein
MVLALVVVTLLAILLFFSLPSCLHLRATPFSKEGVGVGASSSYSSDTSPDTDPCSGYCTSMRTFHSMRAPSFSTSSDVPFVFPAFVVFFLPTCYPRLRSQQRADRRLSMRVWASRSCSWHFFVCDAKEDSVAPVTLRLS